MENVIQYGISLLILDVVILVHEVGHGIVALFFKFQVEELSVGIGPVIYSIKNSKFTFKLRLIPIGGYCIIPELQHQAEETFNRVHSLKRVGICIGGAVANFVFAFFIYMVIGNFSGVEVIDLPNESSQRYTHIANGSYITHINGSKLFTSQDINLLEVGKENKIRGINNKGIKFEEVVEVDKAESQILYNSIKKNISLINRAKNSLIQTSELLEFYFNEFRSLIKDDASLGKELIGDIEDYNFIGTVKVGRETQGISYMWKIYLLIVGIVSISIGAVNMLPIIGLDGWRTVKELINVIINRNLPKISGYIVCGFGIILTCVILF